MVNFWFPMCQCQRWVKKDKLLTQISEQKRIKFLKRFGMSVSYVLLKLPLIKMSQYSLYSSASFLIRKIAGHSWDRTLIVLWLIDLVPHQLPPVCLLWGSRPARSPQSRRAGFPSHGTPSPRGMMWAYSLRTM